MGLLVVDVTAHGVVMSADSQRVEIREGAFSVDATRGRVRNPIIVRDGGGFVGLIGFVGTEQVEGIETRHLRLLAHAHNRGALPLPEIVGGLELFP
jgi:hypothetical protein